MRAASPRRPCFFLLLATAIIFLSRLVVLRAFPLGVASVRRFPSSSSAAAALAIMPKGHASTTSTTQRMKASSSSNDAVADSTMPATTMPLPAAPSSRRRKREIVEGVVVPVTLAPAAKKAVAGGAAAAAVAKEEAATTKGKTKARGSATTAASPAPITTTTTSKKTGKGTTAGAASMSTSSRSAAPKRAIAASASSATAAAAPLSNTTTTTKNTKKKTEATSTTASMSTAAAAAATAAATTTTTTSKSTKKAKPIPLPVSPATAAAALAVARANAGATPNTTILLHTLPTLYPATVMHRPSKVCKSPYLCDIQVEGTSTLTMAHTPSLGCSGLVCPGAEILVSKSTSKSSTAKSTHVLHHVLVREEDETSHWIGTHPLTANILANALLLGGHVFTNANLPPVESVQKEVTMGSSRFDFVVTHTDGSLTVVETKNVPVADNFEGTKKERAALLAACEETPNPYGKVAIFPDGYRKKVSDPVSPRALKHVQELEVIAQEGGKRACLLFISQRTDVASFVVAPTDVQYRAAVQKAADNGVMLKAFSVRWDGASGRAFLHRELPIVWG